MSTTSTTKDQLRPGQAMLVHFLRQEFSLFSQCPAVTICYLRSEFFPYPLPLSRSLVLVRNFWLLFTLAAEAFIFPALLRRRGGDAVTEKARQAL
jgi:hypothetical protein